MKKNLVHKCYARIFCDYATAASAYFFCMPRYLYLYLYSVSVSVYVCMYICIVLCYSVSVFCSPAHPRVPSTADPSGPPAVGSSCTPIVGPIGHSKS